MNNSFRLKTVNSKVNNNLVMIPCRSVYCDKKFSTNTNRNKHERAKGHGPKDKLTKIQFDSENGLYLCPTSNCKTTSGHKRSIVRHLIICSAVSLN